jgi:hypothetical protein
MRTFFYRFTPDQVSGSPPAGNDPPVVVGVVGIGHVAGIVANWDKVRASGADVIILHLNEL